MSEKDHELEVKKALETLEVFRCDPNLPDDTKQVIYAAWVSARNAARGRRGLSYIS